MPDAAAVAAGLVPIGPGVYLTQPTRLHTVLVLAAEGSDWVTWAGRHHQGADGTWSLGKEWELYKGPDIHRAVQSALRFAGRLAR